jgi:hypothetical protein
MGKDISGVLYENEKALFNLYSSTGEHTEKEKEAFVKNLILGRELAEENPSLKGIRKQQKTEERG